jgi:hypothetical protein
MNLLTLRTPLIELRSALALTGLRTREEYDELVHVADDCDIRLSLSGRPRGQNVRCWLSVDEARLLVSGLELFNEIALEGHPVISFGAGRGRVSLAFEWLHPSGADWRISGQRIELLRQRVTGVLGPKPAPLRARRRARAAAERSFLPGVFAGAVSVG